MEILPRYPTPASIPRLYVLVAEQAPIAVVFRRGPTRHWQILKWDLAALTVEAGGQFEGSMYPRRCAISPDGALLAYFAARHFHSQYKTWGSFLAVSKIHWLTALVAWNTPGTWTLGCRFLSNDHLVLADATINQHMFARPFHGSWPAGQVSFAPSFFEDGDLRHEFERRFQRATIAQMDALQDVVPVPNVAYPCERIVLAKQKPGGDEFLLSIHDGHDLQKRGMDGLVVRYALLNSGGRFTALPGLDRADFDVAGRLLVASDQGRLEVRTVNQARIETEWSLDVSGIEPQEQRSPLWARGW